MNEDLMTTRVANIFNIKTYYFSYPLGDMINVYYVFHNKLMLRYFLKIPHISFNNIFNGLTVCGDIKKELNEKLINGLIIKVDDYE